MYSKGISWFDDCRIPFEDTKNPATNPKYRLQGNYKMPEKGEISDGSITQFRSSLNEIDVRGRFPANILVSDDMLNDGKKHGNLFNTNRNKDVDGGTGNSLVRAHKQGESNGVFDNGISSSRFYDIDKWFDNLING
jgi:hypothetical protein